VKAALDKSKIDTVNTLHRQFISAMKKSAKTAFAAGKILHELQTNLLVGELWSQYVKENFCFSERQANTYIRVYVNYKDNPKVLAEMTIYGALDKISRPPPLPPVPVEYGSPSKQLEFEWEASFKKPTASKLDLKNYRFECPDRKSLWLVRRGIPIPEKIVDFRLDNPRGDLKFFYDEMMRTFQIAVEQYYLQIEKEEEREGR
jgi:hypothetical protein